MPQPQEPDPGAEDASPPGATASGADVVAPTELTEPVGAPGPEEPGEKSSLLESVWRFLRELIILVVVSILIASVIKAFLFQVFFIPSGSMEQTLLVGDRVAVDKLSYTFRDVRRGEVVVFRGSESWAPTYGDVPSGPLDAVTGWLRGLVGLPGDERDFIKRVVALGGDTVQCCDTAGNVMVNGSSLDEDYIFENTPLDQRDFGPVLVPDGRLFMLGDHRGLSADSRYHLDDGHNGTVAESDVIGRASAVIWPFANWKRLSVPDTFDTVPAPAGDSQGAGEPVPVPVE